MSDSQELPWSDNPSALKILHTIYLFEKSWFAGTLASSILYGALKDPCIHPYLSVLTAPFVRFF